MDDSRRAILEEVAAGSLTPSEGAARLEAIEQGPRGTTASTANEPAPRVLAGISLVKVVSVMDEAIIVGDDSVAEAVADGPHTVRREGDTVVFEAEGPVGEGYRHERVRRLGWFAGWTGPREPIRVRINPDLPLEVETQAGSVKIDGVRASIRGRVQAGSLKIAGFESPLDISVQAGSVRASGRLSAGASHISCEAGSVKLALAPDSNVRVSAVATLGRVQLGDAGSSPTSRGGIGDRQELVIGAGAASLEIDAAMGSVQVSVDR